MTNTKPQHTPWTSEYIDRHNNSGVRDSEGDLIAIGMFPHHAKLFAAAPELLSELEGYVDAAENGLGCWVIRNEMSDKDIQEIRETIRKSRDLIAKAKGEA